MIDEQTLTVTYTYSIKIDTETGNVVSNELVGRSSSVKRLRKELDEEVPKLYLEDNKLRLNKLAREAFGDDARLCVLYNENGTPVIGAEEAFGSNEGNKVTKSGTVSFRGTKRNELAKLGDEFSLSPSGKPGVYSLIPVNSVKEAVDSREEEKPTEVEDVFAGSDFPVDIFTEDNDNITEVNSDFFKF